MSDLEIDFVPPADLPFQVGALLNYNSELSPAERFLGGGEWVLAGSCVLVAPNAVLTVGHAVSELYRRAVFLPGQGFFETLTRPLVEPSRVRGDNVVLLMLKEEVPLVQPLKYAWVGRKYLEQVEVFGFGRWQVGDDKIPAGILRGTRVFARRDLDYDNLDLIWNASENSRLRVEEFNSGGPMLWVTRKSHAVLVGLNRQSGEGDQQIGSRIAHDRWEWLDCKLGTARESRPRPVKVEWQTVTLSPDSGYSARLNVSVPEEASRVQLTLSASAAALVKMRAWPTQAPGAFKEQVLKDSAPGGRFLYREVALPEGISTLAVGIACEVGDGEEPGLVDVQVCALVV